MEFPAFEHVAWMERAARDGPPRHDLGVSSLQASWQGRLDLSLRPEDVGRMHADEEGALQDALARRWGMGQDQVRLTAGTSGGNLAALLTFVRPGCNVVCERPHYAPLPHLARGLGAEVRFVDRDPERGWRLDPAAVADAVDDDTTLVLLTSPNNPTGAAASGSDLRAIGDAAAAVGAHVLVDQVYRELTEHAVAARAHPACITTAGFNKCWAAPGLRTGWLVGDAAVVGRVRETHRLALLSHPPAGSPMGLALLAQEADARNVLQERLAGTHAVFSEWARATGRSLVRPQGGLGLTVFVDVGDDRAVCEAALAKGLLIIPGSGFGWSGHVRVGLGGDPDALAAGLGVLDGVCSSLRAQTF